MERVVYILGAGFSAPAGLPVMSNFLIRSKDLYFNDEARFQHFGRVFDTIRRMSTAKNYFNADLFNIEEILSILDMEEYVAGTERRGDFTRYVADVISALTPSFRVRHNTSVFPGMFVDDHLSTGYCLFAAALAHLEVWATDTTDEFRIQRNPKDRPQYGVITLNYDVLLERSVDVLNERCEEGDRVQFAQSVRDLDSEPAAIPLAKIHGSVEPLTIVPPTWRKGASKDVREAWELAHALLATATQIRILGYSLPPTDTYIRYLLMNAATVAPHLKNIDVGCLDPDGGVERRFSEFVTFYRYQFRQLNTTEYFDCLVEVGRHSVETPARYARMDLRNLERTHAIAFP